MILGGCYKRIEGISSRAQIGYVHYAQQLMVLHKIEIFSVKILGFDQLIIEILDYL